MQKPSIELKGSSFTLSVLHINTTDLSTLTSDLDKKLSQAPQFFIGAPLVLNLAAIGEDFIDLIELKSLLLSRELIIVGITGACKTLVEQAKQHGFAVLKSGKQLEALPPPPRATRIVKQNIRSGQQIYVKDGDLIVIGAVGNGAEVIADGSIHIYGALRGKAMAGAAGDKQAVILAHSMDPELVSIAGQYWLSENFQREHTATSGCIRLLEESLIFESLPI